MASDYERQINPVRDYAERRGSVFNAHTVEIQPQAYPDQRRIILDGRSMPTESVPSGRDAAGRQERQSAGIDPGRDVNHPEAEREIAKDPEEELRRTRTRAPIRHARAVGVIFDADDLGKKASPEQWKELTEARREFDHVRSHGWQDAEAAYAKDESVAREAGSGKVNRAIRALQIETEFRTSPERRADRFVERWQKLGQASQRQYQAGDMTGYNATRSTIGDWPKASSAIRSLNPSSPAAGSNSAYPSNQDWASAATSPSVTGWGSAGGMGSGCRNLQPCGIAVQCRSITARAAGIANHAPVKAVSESRSAVAMRRRLPGSVSSPFSIPVISLTERPHVTARSSML